jgi:hypothetical protein
MLNSLSSQQNSECSENHVQHYATSTNKNHTRKQFISFLRFPFFKKKKKTEGNINIAIFHEEEKQPPHTPLLQSNDKITLSSSPITNDSNFIRINSTLFRQLQQEHALDKTELGFSVVNEKKLSSVEELRRKIFDRKFNASFYYQAPTINTNVCLITNSIIFY